MSSTPQPNNYDNNSPEHSVAKFLQHWHKREWKDLADLTQISWRKNQNEGEMLHSPEQLKAQHGKKLKAGATHSLRRQFGSMNLIHAEIIDTETCGGNDHIIIAANVKIVVRPNIRNGSFPKELKKALRVKGNEVLNLVMKMNLIREGGDGRPNLNGTWGVNPPSCYRIEKVG